MIAFFGTYKQLREYAAENDIPLKQIVLASVGTERLEGYQEPIAVVTVEDFQPTRVSAIAMSALEYHNRQFEGA